MGVGGLGFVWFSGTRNEIITALFASRFSAPSADFLFPLAREKFLEEIEYVRDISLIS